MITGLEWVLYASATAAVSYGVVKGFSLRTSKDGSKRFNLREKIQGFYQTHPETYGDDSSPRKTASGVKRNRSCPPEPEGGKPAGFSVEAEPEISETTTGLETQPLADNPLPPSWPLFVDFCRRAKEGDESLSDFLRCRLPEMAEQEPDNGEYGYDSWALRVVDFLDEYRLLQQNGQTVLTGADAEVRGVILQIFTEIGASMIDEETWTPSLQRAVSVITSPTPCASPSIQAKGASGLIIRGRLVRKQEVVLIR